MKVTPKMVEILIHATAWEHKTNPLYRNRYSAFDNKNCEKLVELGLMRLRVVDVYRHYVVADDGIAYLLKRERKLRGAATKKAGAK